MKDTSSKGIIRLEHSTFYGDIGRRVLRDSRCRGQRSSSSRHRLVSGLGVQTTALAGSLAELVMFGLGPLVVVVVEGAMFLRGTADRRGRMVRLVLLALESANDGLGGGLAAPSWVHRRDWWRLHAVT